MEPNDVGSGNSLDPYIVGLGAWLSPVMLGYHPASSSFK